MDESSGISRGAVRGFGWPTAAQRLLLSVIVARGDVARDAWRRWRASVQLGSLDAASRRLLPLAVQRFAALEITDHELGRLRGVARHTWASNHCLTRAAREASAALERADIPVCGLKGFALIGPCYDGDLSLRPMYDVDLLVPRERARDAAMVLGALGFSADTGAGRPGLPRLELSKAFMQREMALPLRRGNASLDLHWHIVHQDRSAFFDALAWSHTESLDGGGAIRALGPAEHLVHLCLHGVRHDAAINRIWALDAVRLLERRAGEIAWDRLLEIASARCLSVALHDSLEFLATLTGTVPASVLCALAEQPVSALELLEYRALTLEWSAVAPVAREACRLLGVLRRGHPVVTQELLARAGAPGFEAASVATRAARS